MASIKQVKIGNTSYDIKATYDGNGNNISTTYVKWYSGSSAPSDTSGQTLWFDTSTNLLKFYANGTWRAFNTYS